MPQPNQSTRIATHLMLELAEVRKRLEAAEAENRELFVQVQNYRLRSTPDLVQENESLQNRLEAAEAVVEAARFYVAASLERTELDDAIEAYDELKS